MLKANPRIKPFCFSRCSGRAPEDVTDIAPKIYNFSLQSIGRARICRTTIQSGKRLPMTRWPTSRL